MVESLRREHSWSALLNSARHNEEVGCQLYMRHVMETMGVCRLQSMRREIVGVEVETGWGRRSRKRRGRRRNGMLSSSLGSVDFVSALQVLFCVAG